MPYCRGCAAGRRKKIAAANAAEISIAAEHQVNHKEEEEMIEIQGYSSHWVVWFEELSNWLKSQLNQFGSSYVSIEHVGSTSVPGLWAKPVIDIDIIVTTEQLSSVIEALEKCGHVNRGDMGIPDRYAIKLLNPPYRTNTYVIIQDSIALKNHLIVRDVLRKNEDLRQRYSECKRLLAEGTDDLNVYCEGKTDILAEILAFDGRMSVQDITSIEDCNRRS